MNYEARVKVEAMERTGLLHEITTVMSNEKVNVAEVNSTTDRASSQVNLFLTLFVHDQGELQRVISRLRQLPDVLSVQRL